MFPLSMFTGLLGEDEVHVLRLAGAARSGKGERYHRLASGNLSFRYRDYDCQRDHLGLVPGNRAVE